MRTLLLLLALAGYVIAEVTENDVVLVPREVTIDAAFRYGRDLFLVSGDEYMAVSADGYEKYLKVRTGDTEVPVTWPIQAAVHWPLKSTVYYYGSENSFRANQSSMTSIEWPYGRHRTFLQHGGPDAAAFRAGWFYIFRGCQYVKQAATLWYLGEPEEISNIDESLPCDIDAAWSSVDKRSMTILKGNQIWTWRGDEVTGPVDFTSQYTIWSWQITPTPDDRFGL